MKKIIYAVFALAFQFANAQTTTITLLHYNDLHAHLMPSKHLIRVGDPCNVDANADTIIGIRGGVARIKYLVDSLKTQNPNSVLMNIGDTYHGGVEAAYTSGNAIVDPMNAMGVDVGVPGNWDFAYGPGVWRKRYTPTGPFPQLLNAMLPSYTIKAVTYPCIAANLTYKKLGPLDPSVNNAPVLPSTMTIIKGGVKIGFIGLTSDIVPKMYAQLATGFNFFTGESNYVNIINTQATNLHNAGCSIVVVMSELGIHKDYALAQIINANSVDVFFSAHTHEVTYNPLQSVSGAWVVEAGDDGYLGKMDFIVTGTTVTSKTWNVLSITPNIPENSAMAALVTTERAPFLIANPNLADPMGTSSQTLNEPINDTIGFTNGLLTRKNAVESSFNNAFTDIMRSHAGTQIAISPGFRFDSPVAPNGFHYEDNSIADGSITLEDVYRFFPVFYTLATAQVKGDSLKSIYEKLLTSVYSQTSFNQEGGWLDGFSGVDATINLNNADGARVLNMYYTGTINPINANDTLTAIGCVRPIENADVLCSHTGFFNKADYINTGNSQPYTTIQLFTEFLQTNNVPIGTGNHITDLSGNAAYPQSPWVQPLPSTVLCVTTGVNEISNANNNILIYPNPTNDLLNIQLKSTAEIFTIVVYNTLGEQVFISNNKTIIDISALSQGMYFINVKQGNKIVNAKFMKQ